MSYISRPFVTFTAAMPRGERSKKMDREKEIIALNISLLILFDYKKLAEYFLEPVFYVSIHSCARTLTINSIYYFS